MDETLASLAATGIHIDTLRIRAFPFHDSVTDFIALHWWPVFNVADSAISIAVVLLLAGYVLRKGG